VGRGGGEGTGKGPWQKCAVLKIPFKSPDYFSYGKKCEVLLLPSLWFYSCVFRSQKLVPVNCGAWL